LNPIIKFTTLFGLLAVEIAVKMAGGGHGAVDAAASAPAGGLSMVGLLAVAFLIGGLVFVWRSFYGMRIKG
jgi:K(+)-stimulated pyrophosphate-energized sodium pump